MNNRILVLRGDFMNWLLSGLTPPEGLVPKETTFEPENFFTTLLIILILGTILVVHAFILIRKMLKKKMTKRMMKINFN